MRTALFSPAEKGSRPRLRPHSPPLTAPLIRLASWMKSFTAPPTFSDGSTATCGTSTPWTSHTRSRAVTRCDFFDNSVPRSCRRQCPSFPPCTVWPPCALYHTSSPMLLSPTLLLSPLLPFSQTLELMMSDLDQDAMKMFYKVCLVSSRQSPLHTGAPLSTGPCLHQPLSSPLFSPAGRTERRGGHAAVWHRQPCARV